MSLRTFFFLALLLRLPVYAAAIYLSYPDNMHLFYGVELFLVLDAVVSYIFYRRVMTPLDTVQGALNLLNGQDWNVSLLKTGQPEVDGLVEVFNRMMRALHDQRVLMREQSNFLSLLVDMSPSGVIVCDFDGKVQLANPAARRLLGDDVLGPAITAMPDGADISMRRPDGTVIRCLRRHFLENGVRNTFYIIENVTEPVAAAEKDAYDKLIRLMAHEVNNTVAGLATAMDALSGIDPDGDEVLASCKERAIALSRFISRFADVARMPDPELVKVDLVESVSVMCPFLESLCQPRRITLEMVMPDAPVVVRADTHMLEQVIVNIVKNAVESIGSDGAVELRIDELARTLTVTDNGPGIAPEKAAKLFTPFFTDKPDGQGIGLTFVREALRRHGCTYSLATDTADGLTRFSIKFPV